MAPILSPLPALGGLISDRLLRLRQPTTIGEEDTHPTRTLPQAISKIISARQAATTTVVADTGSSSGGTGLSGGAIAGIVVGAVVGTLLLLWLIRSCLNLGYPGIWGSTFEPGHEKPSAAAYDYPSSGHHHHHHHRRHRPRSSQRSRSRHSRSLSRSPRRVSVSATRPVVVAPPQPAYYPRKGEVEVDPRDVRRGSDGRRYRRY